jgi:hypothetical protein
LGLRAAWAGAHKKSDAGKKRESMHEVAFLERQGARVKVRS